MGEICIVVFLGIWLVSASIIIYRRLKKELGVFVEDKKE